MLRFIPEFFSGCVIPFRALSLLIRSPRLWFWAALPTLVTATAYFLLFREFLEWLKPLLPVWVTYSLGGIVLLVGIFFFTTASTLIAGPLYDLLSERAENLIQLPPVPANEQGLQAWPRHLSIDLVKSFFALLGYALSLAFSWVPILNLFSVLISCLLITYQFVSYAQTRRGIGPLQAVRLLLADWPRAFGMGLVLAFPLAIPIVSFFVLPTAIVSGVMFSKRCPTPF